MPTGSAWMLFRERSLRQGRAAGTENIMVEDQTWAAYRESGAVPCTQHIEDIATIFKSLRIPEYFRKWWPWMTSRGTTMLEAVIRDYCYCKRYLCPASDIRPGSLYLVTRGSTRLGKRTRYVLSAIPYTVSSS